MRLSLTLLGAFQIALDGEPVTGFESDKVRALLVYLALEADRPHRRDTLAEMFWPDRPPGVARNSLKQALANLRKAISDREADPPFLLVSRAKLQFNSDSVHWLDVSKCSGLLADRDLCPRPSGAGTPHQVCALSQSEQHPGEL